ncbi:AAA+ family ATPase, partial [cyanobacterium TDX16]
LTEAARAVEGALFVVSIPASQGTAADDEAQASSLEVGSAAGQEALARLTNVISRQAEHWQPAKGDESFEIVRRRLFEPLAPGAQHDRDATAAAFGELYRSLRGDFPAEASEVAYEERIKTAYPIHPEVFDRLYEDWSTVDRFQRTRGVLRLMAAVINSLWESDDRSPLILPCSIPLDDGRVRGELAGKLPDYWDPVLDADVDGRDSRPAQIDREVPHLGQHHATRRVARTIFLGATPNVGAANRGVDAKTIRLGSVFAGEKPGFIADALNRLAAQAPYLYVDRDRYWFDRQQNVSRTARDDAAHLLAGDKHE